MLTAGTKLGVYRVLALIGAGGMGEVYRARDTTLDRDVAIKILPDAFAADAERVARFQREAKTLAALNHPNIAAIYGLEEAPAEAGHHVQALVMELVEGEDLSQKLEGLKATGTLLRATGASVGQAGLPLAEALAIAKQIADALEAAHEQGIIHRDLKPANVKVRADGTVKVLDFGLAKAMGPAEAGHYDPNVAQGFSPAGLSQSPTMMSPAQLSGVGMILGTAAYMAPEQARGKPVDKRADVWAFGAVLFEMLTGTPPFPGDDISHILARVIERDPDWTALPPALSPALRTYLRRCLTKDPRQRIRDIGDVRLALEGAFDADPAAAQPAAPATPRSVLARALPWAAAAAFAVATCALLALGLGVGGWSAGRTAPPRVISRVEITTPLMPDSMSFAMSVDGRALAYVAATEGTRTQLFVRRLDQATATPLPGTDGARFPFWAPDGRALGFFADGKLKRIELAGGAPQVLADAPQGRGGTWNQDGVIVFAPNTNGGLQRVSAAGGTPSPVTTSTPDQTAHRWPQFLPDGRHFLFTVAIGRTRGTFLTSLDGGDPMRVTNQADALFVPPDRLLVLQQDVLKAVPFDVARARVAGDGIPVAQDVGYDGPQNRAAVAVSATGVIATRGESHERRQLVWMDRNGRLLGPLGPADDDSLANPALSPDGRRVAMNRFVDGKFDVWLQSVGGASSRLTFGARSALRPAWSPDGSRVLFDANNPDSPGVFDIMVKPSNGASDDQPVIRSPQAKYLQDWSSDGRTILFTTAGPSTVMEIWSVAVGDHATPVPFLQAPFDVGDAQFSPDGHWVAYESNQNGRVQISVRPYPGPGGQWQVSSDGGSQPRWRRDGKELFFVAPDGKLMAVALAPSADGRALQPGPPMTLFAPRWPSGPGISSAFGTRKPQYAVARDGRFLVNSAVGGDIRTPINLILNWDALLRH